ncbi:MAG: Hpt domain-containing protein, partial [Pseudomonadota bacterium]
MTSDDEILAIAREGFMDEAKDNLRQFEEALLAMEQDPQDAEALNSAFRAAHTIKGGAGMFGFEAVVTFTHEVESVLECMRCGQLPLSEAGMAMLLQGQDQMARLLAEVGQDTVSADVASLSEQLGAELRALRGGSGVAVQAPSHAKAVTPQEGLPTSAGALWHISIRMGGDALRNGLDPMSFIRYLKSIGQVAGIRTLSEPLPDLLAMDAEACYLGFEIRLATQADRATIEQVFEFLADDADIVYLAPDASQEDYRALLEKRAPEAAAQAVLLAHWQVLAGPDAPPFIDRRSDTPGPDRRLDEPERRTSKQDRRTGEDTRFIRVRADKLDKLID